MATLSPVLLAVAVFIFLFSTGLYGAMSPAGHGGKDTYITPSPFTFYIWTLIDLLLLGYCVYQFFDSSHDAIVCLACKTAKADVDLAAPHSTVSAGASPSLVSSILSFCTPLSPTTTLSRSSSACSRLQPSAPCITRWHRARQPRASVTFCSCTRRGVCGTVGR